MESACCPIGILLSLPGFGYPLCLLVPTEEDALDLIAGKPPPGLHSKGMLKHHGLSLAAMSGKAVRLGLERAR